MSIKRKLQAIIKTSLEKENIDFELEKMGFIDVEAVAILSYDLIELLKKLKQNKYIFAIKDKFDLVFNSAFLMYFVLTAWLI